MPPKRCRNFRKRTASSESEEQSPKSDDVEDDSAVTNEAINLAKQLKELRKRPRGIVADVSKDTSSTVGGKAESNSSDSQTKGGLIDLKTNFLAESQKGDMDREMLKFIETELKKHRGENVDTSPTKNNPEKNLFELPDHLNVHSAVKGDDMMSQQMLEGIPEVDLGITNKIRNIEATEKVKQKLREEARLNKGVNLQDETYNVKGFVPNNVTVNFVQHNRWDGEGVFKSLVPHAPTNLKKSDNLAKPSVSK